MNPDREQARALLQAVACGDLRADAPEWLATVQRFPELAAELTELRALQQDLDWSTLDAAVLAADAATTATPADRANVRAAAQRRRRTSWLWPLLVAAMLVVAWTQLAWSPAKAPGNGMLGGSGAVQVESSADAIRVHGLAPLPPGGHYRVELHLPDRTLPAASFATQPIELPDAWRLAIHGAAHAHLIIHHPDGEAVRVPLRD